MRRSGARAPEEHDLLEPDDDPPYDAGARWPAAGRAARRPRPAVAGALAGAAVAALVVGAATAAHERAVAAAALRRGQAALALQAGLPSSTVLVLRPAAGDDAGTPTTYDAGVPLTNRGGAPVLARVLGVDLPGTSLEEAPPPVVVPAGATVAVRLALRADCAAFPASRQVLDDVQGRTALRVVVRPADEGSSDDGVGGGGDAGDPVALPLPAPGPFGLSLPAQVAAACAGGPGQLDVATTATPVTGGALRVVVTGRPGALPDALRLAVRASPALTVTTEPPLPATTGRGSSFAVTLAVRADCAALPTGPGRGSGLSVALVADGPRGAPPLAPDPDGAQAAWVARQVALQCG